MEQIGTSNLIETWGSNGTSVKPDSSKIAEGWQLGEQPPHEWMNWLQNTFGQKINHILKNGVAEWNLETPYLAGATVQYLGDNWICKTANTNSIPSLINSNWKQNITSEVYNNGLGKQGYTHTANATFTSIDNKIVMLGIASTLGLEVGDVITFNNANVSNNKPHTVESITNNDTIVVNYEHCGSRGNGSLKLVDETITLANCKLLAKWFVAPAGLGVSAVNTTNLRVINTNYYGIPNRQMGVTISDALTAAGWSTEFYVNSDIKVFGGKDSYGALTRFVNRDEYYKFSMKHSNFSIAEVR